MTPGDFAAAIKQRIESAQVDCSSAIVKSDLDEMGTVKMRGVWHGLGTAWKIVDDTLNELVIPAAEQAAQPEQEAIY